MITLVNEIALFVKNALSQRSYKGCKFESKEAGASSRKEKGTIAPSLIKLKFFSKSLPLNFSC